MRSNTRGLTRARIESLVVIGAVVYFVGSAAILHMLRSDIDPLRQGLSYYGRGPYSLVMNTAFAAVGIAGIILAFGLYQITRSGRSRLGLGMLAIWGFAQVVAAMFPTELPGEKPTSIGTVHSVVGFSFVLIGPATLLISRAFSNDPYWASWARSAALGGAAVLVLSVLLFVFNGVLQPLGVGGLAQRLYWLAVVLWLSVTAARLRAAPPE